MSDETNSLGATARGIALAVDSIHAALSDSTPAANRLIEAAYAQARAEPDRELDSIADRLVPENPRDRWEAWMQLGLCLLRVPQVAGGLRGSLYDLAGSMLFDVLRDVAEYGRARVEPGGAVELTDFGAGWLEQRPRVLSTKRVDGIAGQYSIEAVVEYYDGEQPMLIVFAGSTYGGPIVAAWNGRERFVAGSVLDRLGATLSEAWVRAYYGEMAA